MATEEEKERIREEGLTTEDVLDREFAEPMQEVQILPEWEECPEEAPGENVRIEGDELVWERDGFEARLASYDTTHWKATIDIPREYGEYLPRPVDLKSDPVPEYGFVDVVEIEDYATVGATIILQENYQPAYEVNKFIDHIIEKHQGTVENLEEIEEKMAVAKENESE